MHCSIVRERLRGCKCHRKLDPMIGGSPSACANVAIWKQAQLASMGTIPGAALSWHKRIEANWSRLFDAIYVLGEERPTTIVAGN